MEDTGSQWIYERLKDTDIRMLKFSGDNDLVVSTAGTLGWINELNWNKTSDWDYYTLADNQVAGFI